MSTAIIGLLGIFLGLVLSEYFRKRSRIEAYSREVFQKRLNVYEELYQRMLNSHSIAFDVIENTNYSRDERKAIWSEVVLSLAKFTDES